MDAIRKAIMDVRARIPKALLERAFINRFQGWNSLNDNNVDRQIEQLVIRPRVMVDCDLVGGTQVNIPLNGLEWSRPDSITTVVRIPKTLTQGRSITSIIHLSYVNPTQMGTAAYLNGFSGSSSTGSNESTELNNLMNTMVNSHDRIPITTSSNVELIAENVIMIRDLISIPTSCFLMCVVGNQDNLGNIHPRSIPAFSEMTVLAVKAYIYNSLIVEVDTGELQGGFQLGVFKSILEGYSDSDQAYLDYLNGKWRKVAFINDRPAWRRFVKMNVGGAR